VVYGIVLGNDSIWGIEVHARVSYISYQEGLMCDQVVNIIPHEPVGDVKSFHSIWGDDVVTGDFCGRAPCGDFHMVASVRRLRAAVQFYV
jgi:hypothetical protein